MVVVSSLTMEIRILISSTCFMCFCKTISRKQTPSKLWEFILTNGAYHRYIYYSQDFYLAVLTLLIISFVIGIVNGKINTVLLFKIALFGLFLFLLIPDILQFAPLLLLISADTCYQIVHMKLENLTTRLQHNKRPTRNKPH